MASERLRSAQDLLDLTFQSLAMQHMDLKQVELDTAVAKVDELSRQLESLWTDGPGPPKEQFSRNPLEKRNVEAAPPELPGDILGGPGSARPPHFLPGAGGEDRAPSPRPKMLAVPYEGGRAPSPRPPLPAPHRPPYEFLGSPRGGGEGGGAFFSDRAPSPRPPAPPPYEMHGLYPSLSGPPGIFRAQDDLSIKRRPQKSWNESDLDVAYEKKSSGSGGYDRSGEGPRPHLGLGLAPWRESSLDGQGKDGVYGVGGGVGGHSATLPRNYKVTPPFPGERRGGPEGFFRRVVTPPNRGGGGQQQQQPVSRIPVPPPPAPPQTAGAALGGPPGRPPRHKPLPLSVIFKLQNAFWEQGVFGGPPLRGGGILGVAPPPPASPRAPQKQAQLPALPPPGPPGGEGPPVPPRLDPPDEAELEGLFPLAGGGGGAGGPEGLRRPLSPTRLQPLLPPEARRVPEFREVARVLAEMPRPLKRRGSLEQTPPARARHYRQLVTRLLRRPPAPTRPEPPQNAAEAAEPQNSGPALAAAPAAATVAGDAGTDVAQSPPVASAGSPAPLAVELRSALRDPSSPRRRPGARVRLNPLVLLLDAALTGELDVVQQAVAELNDPSQPNDEGITALHNAICGANYAIVDFLIASGADVNSPDSHGWTPLHCAASCNDTGVCVALVRHGAAIFATTASDGSLAVEKCDPYREGYADCYSYLTEVEQSMGVQNSGVVYALWDYSAELADELSFREGEPVTVLRRQQPPDQLDWWWGSLYGHEGYVPRNYFGLFPRVRPQRKKV